MWFEFNVCGNYFSAKFSKKQADIAILFAYAIKCIHDYGNFK